MTGKQLRPGEYDQAKGDTEKAPHNEVSGSRLGIVTQGEYEKDTHTNVGTGHHRGNKKPKRILLEIFNFPDSETSQFQGCIFVHALPYGLSC